MKKENEMSNFEKDLKFIGAYPMSDTEEIAANALLKNSFFKEKYRKSLKTLTKVEMRQLQKVHPEWQLKDVLSALFNDFNPELPSSILLEMTQFIIVEWEKTHQSEPLLC